MNKKTSIILTYKLINLITFTILKKQLHPIIIGLALTFCSCGISKTDDGNILIINPSNAKQLSIKDFNLKVTILNMPDSVEPGYINEIQFVGGYYIIFDRDLTKTISFFDSVGNFITQLNKQGKGPLEYTNIECFTFNPFRKELIIHEIGVGIKVYDFPSFNTMTNYPQYKQVLSIKLLNSEQYLILNSAEKEGTLIDDCLHIVDSKFKIIRKSNLVFSPLSLELSYPNTFSLINNTLYFIQPGKYSSLYRIRETLDEEICKLNFGTHQVNDKLWENFEFGADMEEEVVTNNKAVLLHNITMKEDTIYAWFKYRSLEDIYFAEFHPATGYCSVFSTLEMFHSDIGFPFPSGTAGSSFLGIVDDVE